VSDLLRFQGIEPEVEVRSESDREIGIRFMKYGEIGRTESGLEMFEAGAFAGTDPTSVILRAEHEGPPAGRGIALEERGDSAIFIAKVAPTARGDELMTLAREGYFRGASPSFVPVEKGTAYRNVGRERVAVRQRVDLREISVTWRPTYAGTEVLYARSQMEVGQVNTTQEDSQVTDETAKDAEDVQPRQGGYERPTDPQEYQELRKRLEVVEARSQAPTEAVIPVGEDPKPSVSKGDWMRAALTLMEGGELHPMERRTLADNISEDNPGFMPVAFSNELIGIIDPARPFMESTTRIDMPAAGLQISYPRITQRPLVAEQTTEKTEVASRKVTTDRITKDVRTFAGAGDLSLQLLRRSSPEFLSAYLELLAEAYASVTEDAAVDALLAASPTAGTGQFEADAPEFAEAFENAAAVGRSLKPNRIWLSTTALGLFIDAKNPSGGGGQPMYPSLVGLTGIGGGGSGLGLQLEPVWVPALDNEAVDVIIGPSRGFAWAEEGTFTLQADVPGRLGRDVALGGFVAFVELYPAAFTTYVIAT
jgi:phage head maturation protease